MALVAPVEPRFHGDIVVNVEERPGNLTDEVYADIEPFDRESERIAFGIVASIIRRLRGPGGCPWDQKQTVESLRRFIVEESFELVAAMTEHDPSHIAEELGDVLLVALLVADALEQSGGAPFETVLSALAAKLVRRHPHVFGDVSAKTPEQVVATWDEVKRTTEGRDRGGVASVARGLPPLMEALEVQKYAAKRGFDWPSSEPVIEKLHEEIAEVSEALEASRQVEDEMTRSRVEAEIGDVLFTAVNLARKAGIDPSIALSGTTGRFRRRYGHVETTVARDHDAATPPPLETLDRYWDDAKRIEANEASRRHH